MSNYTASLELENVKLKFLTQTLNKRAFIASQMIKRDLKTYTANEIELINEERLKYFHHSLKEVNIKSVINIDLKNAYACVLFNDGFISQKTYKYLLTLPKKDRLASVGMLAYKREIFEFENGNLLSSDFEEGEYKNVFFYCVRKVHLIIKEISEMFEKKFLFSWVDGVYFHSVTPELIKAFYYLTEKKYAFTVENLKDFKCRKKDTSFHITFKKGKEIKLFNIPVSSFNWQNEIYNVLNNKYKNDN